MKAVSFPKFKTQRESQYSGLGIQFFSQLFYLRTSEENTIQSCEYPLVPLPRK